MAQPAEVVRPWPVVVAAVAVEVLAAFGVMPVWSGLGHEVALPPLDLASDLAVLLTRATSWVWFGVGLAAALLGRSLLLSAALGWSRRRFGLVLRFYLACLVPCYVAVALIDTAQMSLYALLFWYGLAVLGAVLLLLAPLAWRRRGLLGSWWASVTAGARLPTLVVYLVALVLLAGVARLGGGAAERVEVAVSALLTGWAGMRLADPGPRPARLRVFWLVIAAAVVAAVVLVPGARPAPAPAAAPRTGSLFLVPGIDTSSGHGTMFNLAPRTLGYSCSSTYYFSYRGPGSGSARDQSVCPIRTGATYFRTDTELPLSRLVAAFDAEVARLPAPVTVVTHSSGSWVAWAAITGGGAGGVDRLVMLGPLADPLGYPPPGADGPGVAGAAGARLVTALARRSGFSTFRLDAPLATELMGDPAALPRLLDRPLPAGVRALAVTASYDLPLLAGTAHPFPRAELACPVGASHSAVVTAPATAAVVNRFLAGRALPGCGFWDRWSGLVGSGFRVPPPSG